jgi:hypothetical protein
MPSGNVPRLRSTSARTHPPTKSGAIDASGRYTPIAKASPETPQSIEWAIDAALETIPGARVIVTTEVDGDRPVVRFAGSLSGTDIKPIRLVVPSYGVEWSAVGSVSTLVEGGDTQELLAVLPHASRLALLLPEDAQQRLVHKCRRLQGVPVRLLRQVRRRHRAQLVVEGSGERVG